VLARLDSDGRSSLRDSSGVFVGPVNRESSAILGNSQAPENVQVPGADEESGAIWDLRFERETAEAVSSGRGAAEHLAEARC
jgi:hypothetical protein